MIDVIPGIFEQDFSEIQRKVALVAPYVEWVQIDFSDGSFVPAKTCMDIAKFNVLTRSTHSRLSLEAHLMVTSPVKYIKPLVDAGFKRIIAHVESEDPRQFLDSVIYESVEVGLAIDGPTELELIEPYLEEIDVVLVIMAEVGASGIALEQENIEKVRAIREGYTELTIEAEEGITDETARVVIDAGATVLVARSYIFTQSQDTIGQAIAKLKKG